METTTATTVQAVIDSNPKACYRTLARKLHRLGLFDSAGEKVLSAARPHCGYHCDGDDGPHPLNGSPGCYYSGRCED
jgi:hypothetical protein